MISWFPARKVGLRDAKPSLFIAHVSTTLASNNFPSADVNKANTAHDYGADERRRFNGHQSRNFYGG
jgi:hypothetical protein